MKKFLTLMIMLGLFAMPSITTEAALTPPALWDYAFIHNGTNFVFSDGTNTYTPEFTRTPDGIFFDYLWTGDANGLLPFEITLDFQRSDTTWTLGTTGYIATDTKIGNNTQTIANKTKLIIDNLSTNDYYLIYDLSSSGGARGYDLTINNSIVGRTLSNGWVLLNTDFGRMYIPSNTELIQSAVINNNPVYIDAFYIVDLGTSSAYTAGVESTTAYQEGYETGFGFGYQAGVEEDNAYALGYAKGLSEGQDMETGSSILIFVVAAIGFIMMIFGFTTKRGIFNLLSVGAFVVLGAMLSAYIGFIIIAIGLVIVNVYYAFWGDI